jgi:hypothetical protein
MCIKLNVYGFGIYLKSQIESGNHGGSSVAVISTSADQARNDLIGFAADEYPNDQLVKISGPNIIVEGALYEAGTPPEPPPEVPPEEPASNAKTTTHKTTHSSHGGR